MAKKIARVENKQVCSCSKLVMVLCGILLIVLGAMLYLYMLSLEQVVAIVLVVFGIKKISWAAKCC